MLQNNDPYGPNETPVGVGSALNKTQMSTPLNYAQRVNNMDKRGQSISEQSSSQCQLPNYASFKHGPLNPSPQINTFPGYHPTSQHSPYLPSNTRFSHETDWQNSLYRLNMQSPHGPNFLNYPLPHEKVVPDQHYTRNSGELHFQSKQIPINIPQAPNKAFQKFHMDLNMYNENRDRFNHFNPNLFEEKSNGNRNLPEKPVMDTSKRKSVENTVSFIEDLLSCTAKNKELKHQSVVPEHFSYTSQENLLNLTKTGYSKETITTDLTYKTSVINSTRTISDLSYKSHDKLNMCKDKYFNDVNLHNVRKNEYSKHTVTNSDYMENFDDTGHEFHDYSLPMKHVSEVSTDLSKKTHENVLNIKDIDFPVEKVTTKTSLCNKTPPRNETVTKLNENNESKIDQTICKETNVNDNNVNRNKDLEKDTTQIDYTSPTAGQESTHGECLQTSHTVQKQVDEKEIFKNPTKDKNENNLQQQQPTFNILQQLLLRGKEDKVKEIKTGESADLITKDQVTSNIKYKTLQVKDKEHTLMDDNIDNLKPTDDSNTVIPKNKLEKPNSKDTLISEKQTSATKTTSYNPQDYDSNESNLSQDSTMDETESLDIKPILNSVFVKLDIEGEPSVDVKVENMYWTDIEYVEPFLKDSNGVARDNVTNCNIVDSEESIDVAKDAAKNGPDPNTYYECPHCSLLLNHPKRFMIHVKWHNFGLINERRNTTAKEREIWRNQRREARVVDTMNSKEVTQAEPNKKIYQCKDCDKSFSTKGSLRNHRNRYHPARMHECRLCGVLLPGWMALRSHMDTHQSEKLECNYCHKVYKHKQSLLKHRYTHLEKTVPCEQCDKKFGSMSQMRMHMKLHERVAKGAKFQCSYCAKSFYEQYHLTVHERTHRNERPFVCNICNSAYCTNAGLKRHLKVSHNASKPFQCEHCKRNFTTARMRDRHIAASHPNPDNLQFQCTICDRKYTRSKDLQKHTYKVHSKKPKTNRKKKAQSDSE